MSTVVVPDHTITRSETWNVGFGADLTITDTDPVLNMGMFRGARTDVKIAQVFGGALQFDRIDSAIVTLEAVLARLVAVRDARAEGRPS